MLENIILWLIIGAALIYCGRRVYLTLSGKSRGCGCACDPTKPAPQQIIPDLSGKNNGNDKESSKP